MKTAMARFLVGRVLFVALLIAGAGTLGDATPLSVRPITLVGGPTFSMVVGGTISMLGNSSVIDDWNITVTTRDRLGHYTNTNTARNFSEVSVSSDGQRLTVATSPDHTSSDGGSLIFRSPNPFVDFGVAVADFAGPNASGGQALYMAGGAFDFLDLNQPDGTDYLAAQKSSSPGNVFALTPLSFPNGVTLTGTLQTDGSIGTLGLSSILSWDITVEQVTQDTFNKSNSVLLANGLSFDPGSQVLSVNNPGGSLAFSKGNRGGHPYMVQLADFANFSGGGQAGYYQGPLSVDTINLKAPRGQWAVTGTTPIQSVPEPATVFLLGLGFAGIAGAARKKTARLRG